MASFQIWLQNQEPLGNGDPVGWLALRWRSFEGNRPRLSSPVKIGAFLSDQAETEADRQAVLAAVATATDRYRRRAETVQLRDGEVAHRAEQPLAGTLPPWQPPAADAIPLPVPGPVQPAGPVAGAIYPVSGELGGLPAELAQPAGQAPPDWSGHVPGPAQPAGLAPGHADGDGCVRLTGSSADDLPRIGAHFGVPPVPAAGGIAEVHERLDALARGWALTQHTVDRIALRLGVERQPLDQALAEATRYVAGWLSEPWTAPDGQPAAQVSGAGQLSGDPAAAPAPSMAAQLYGAQASGDPAGDPVLPDPRPAEVQRAEFEAWWGIGPGQPSG